jgi:3',5'-cyclic AMP phosphodiesterase CpdA
MRLLHVTDFHYRSIWFEWVRAQAFAYDACCFSGDLLDMFPSTPTDLHRQARWVRDWLRDFPRPMFVCSGNHDWWTVEPPLVDTDTRGGWLRKAARPGVSVDGSEVKLDGCRFVCCPWASTPAVTGTDPVVLLVHAPPAATPVSSDLGHEVGDLDVAAAVMTLPPVSLVLSGHVHHPRRWHCRLGPAWCFNPGVDSSRNEPNHIVIDTDARTAVFHGYGREIGPIRLDP